MGSCFEIFNTWDEEFVKFQALLWDIMKNDDRRIIFCVNPAHKKLQIRMKHIHNFRILHEKLLSVIEHVLPVVHGNANNEEALNAYARVQEVEVLEISKKDQVSWDTAIRQYNERVDTFEARIAAVLREQLATAMSASSSANEMFRIFERFDGLFFRPKIRGALRKYQTLLIQRVKDDVEALHEKFETQYSSSISGLISELQDIPLVSGAIRWVQQFDGQLATYMRRVEAVLGSGWEYHVEGGQGLKRYGDGFRIKLNMEMEPMFEEWVFKVEQNDAKISGSILDIGSRNGKEKAIVRFRFKVNFPEELLTLCTLSKEVHQLQNLGFRVPLDIVMKAQQGHVMYPLAISLMKSIRTYERSWEKVGDNARVALLVFGIGEEVKQLLNEGLKLEWVAWDSYKLEPYVKKLSEAVFQFAEKVDQVLSVEMQVSVRIKELETCPVRDRDNTFRDILAKIHKARDDLNSLMQCTTTYTWVQEISAEAGNSLTLRLEADIAAGCLYTLDGLTDTEIDVLSVMLSTTHSLRVFLRMNEMTN